MLELVDKVDFEKIVVYFLQHKVKSAPRET